ncbi:MAG: sigma-70 family RNA polymerase sigma factor [Planctomycetota bacterium]|nr:sigma-70 family RNA polymerase sigma factor [Planctomycetota bacterium]
MQNSDNLRTRGTLLGRLRNVEDQQAWEQFINCYTPRIYAWCRKFGLQESDAADITQDVLGKLVLAMKSFEYDPRKGSFRGWLKTVTNNAIRDLLKSFQRPGRGVGDTSANERLATLVSNEALQTLSEMLTAEGERELLQEAEARVKERVKPVNWEAYVLTAHEDMKAPAVAQRLGIAVADVYVAKSRIIKLLKQEVERLNQSPLDT